jgi:hypothetical protein
MVTDFDCWPVANYAFDVRPARILKGLITERGVLRPDRDALASAFPERVGEAPTAGEAGGVRKRNDFLSAKHSALGPLFVKLC